MSNTYPIDQLLPISFEYCNPYGLLSTKEPSDDTCVYINSDLQVKKYNRFKKASEIDSADSYSLISQHIFNIGRELTEDVFKFSDKFKKVCEVDIKQECDDNEILTWKKVKLINEAILIALGKKEREAVEEEVQPVKYDEIVSLNPSRFKHRRHFSSFSHSSRLPPIKDDE